MPKAVHRSAVPGVVLLVIGPVMLAFSGGWGATGGRAQLFTLVGLVAVAVGPLLLAPLAISVLAVVARRLPIAGRIALRDLARYRARSGMALAATSLAVLIAVLIALMATGRYADAVDYFGPNLPSNQVVVYAPGYGPGGGGGPGPGSTAQSPAALQAHATAIAASIGSHDVLALESSGAQLAHVTTQGLSGGPGNVWVATPDAACDTTGSTRVRSIQPRSSSPLVRASKAPQACSCSPASPRQL